jgi:hypothetical protein
MTANVLTCDVCNNESGGAFVGVAAVPGAPMSIAWCSECLSRNSAPAFIFEYDFVYVANGDVDALNDWARSRVTWADGRYIPFEEYVKRLTPEWVKEQMDEYERAMRVRHEEEEKDEEDDFPF